MDDLEDLILDHLGAFADPERRRAAATDLARGMGALDLLIFTPDPELGVLLPAPGFAQTLRHAAVWRAFLARCAEAGEATGELPDEAGTISPASGIATAGGVIAVVIGADTVTADLARLRPALTLLGTLFAWERRAEAAEVRVAAAGEAADRAGAVTEALQSMRSRLEAALHETEGARKEARRSADEAELLAEELRAQAAQLEDQTVELELLNTELEARTDEAEVARITADTANRAKSEFLAAMSHELRTPINAIIGYTEILELGISGTVTPQQRIHLQRVRASSRHLLTLINDVLDLAKIEAGHMTVARRKSLVDSATSDALALLTLQASERSIELKYECADRETVYVGDENRVRQIVANLLSNAIKFTEPGGSVTVRCGSSESPPPEARLTGDSLWTYIEVADTGIGMTAEEIGAVFQPFVQAEGSHSRGGGGTGLGLTISRQLARLMGGDLVGRSVVGEGSSFTVWLPATVMTKGSLDDSIRVSSSRADAER